MIVTRQKNFDTILDAVGRGPVFIIGCKQCATLCGTGGETQVLAMKKALEQQQVPVTGWLMLDPACHQQNDKRLMKACADEMSKAAKILMLACGNGVQTVVELQSEKEVISGTDTLFLGEIVHVNEFQRRCSLCGDCLVDSFAGFCPVSRCPKSMLNGPCGGSSKGDCEIEKGLPCVWDQVYQSLKQCGKLSLLRVVQPPKDWSKSAMMNRSL